MLRAARLKSKVEAVGENPITEFQLDVLAEKY